MLSIDEELYENVEIYEQLGRVKEAIGLLTMVSQRGDWQYLILYMLRAVDSTARLTYRKVNDILEAKEAILEAMESEQNFKQPGQIIDIIFRQPFTKVSHLTDAGLYAGNTARSYLKKLDKIGVLEKQIIKVRHYYRNMELEEILTF